MEHYGQLDAGSTLYIPFTTHDTDGAPIAPSSAFEAADVRIYKNGSATQRSSEAGYTMTSPFDSVTGLHLLAVDLSDNTDAGFYAAGSRYFVVLVPDETVDALAVVRVLADFTIGPVAANVTQVSGDATAADNLESYLDGSEFMPVDAHMQEFTVTGTTLQPKKPDGTTNTGYSRTLGTDPSAEPIVSST
jgi:hypothetical protein